MGNQIKVKARSLIVLAVGVELGNIFVSLHGFIFWDVGDEFSESHQDILNSVKIVNDRCI